MTNQESLEFFNKEATADGDNGNTFKLSRGSYCDFMAQHGVTKEILDTVDKANSALITGAYQFTTDKLKTAAEAAKKANKDPKDLTVKLTVNTTNGLLKQSTTCTKEYHNPSDLGKPVTKVAVAKTTIRVDSWIDKDVVTEVENGFKKLLGL